MPFTKTQLTLFISALCSLLLWVANRCVDKVDAQADLVSRHDKKIAVVETKIDNIEKNVDWIAQRMGKK